MRPNKPAKIPSRTKLYTEMEAAGEIRIEIKQPKKNSMQLFLHKSIPNNFEYFLSLQFSAGKYAMENSLIHGEL